MSEKYKLIWFQHLQKAAGSSIVRMAMQNGERLYPFHRNGNPYYPDGREICLWDFNKQELTSFIDKCQDNGVTFIATEKAAPLFSVLISDPRVYLVTCLRDPLERFISHYYYQLYTGRTNVSSLEAFINSAYIPTMPNYYCRIFSRFHDNPQPIGEEQFNISFDILNSFDSYVILEDKNPFTELNKLLAWKDMGIIVNPTKLNLMTLIKFLAKGRINLIARRITHPRKKPSEYFLNFFKKINKWDYSLYVMSNKGK